MSHQNDQKNRAVIPAKSTRSLRLLQHLGAAMLAGGVGACAVEAGDEPMATTQEPLYYDSTALWPQRDISVCWETSGNATEKAWVKQALRGQRSWAAAGDINFVGWGDCGSSTSGIHVRAGTDMSTSHLGVDSSGPTVITLDFSSTPQNTWARCSANGLSREACIKTVALHEFGHAIGYAHEQNRGSAPSECSVSTPQGSDGDTTYGSFDVDSIMAYCNFSTELSSLDQRGTERVYGPPFRDSPALSDYNGDGRVDLLCWDVLSGDEFVDYASASGQLDGTDWSASTGYCNGTNTRRLFTGDYNGDGRGDLLCFDTVSGAEYIDYADASGHFAGADWSANLGWCNATPDRRLFVGDFNGDGRDDLLCFDRSSGAEYIDYADATGHFAGTDWSANLGWCNATATRRLHVGDFNGDGRDDLLCHDIADGSIYIDYADSTGHFAGTNWSRAASLCNFDGGALFLGDFNGDHRIDLLCHNGTTGHRWIDFADASGQFNGVDWTTTANGWCRANGSRIFVGDVNGDGRDDLVCQNDGSGAKFVDYADASGHLDGTDWSVSDGWCNYDSRDLH